MTFKDQLLKQLNPGEKFVRMYSISDHQSIIEINVNGIPGRCVVNKMDISSVIKKIPRVEVSAAATYNDVYAILSDRYNLGLVQGIDYVNGALVDAGRDPKWIPLPISGDSYGYNGSFGAMVVLDGSSLVGITERDLTEVESGYLYADLRIRSFLVSKVFKVSMGKRTFTENKLSRALIELLEEELETYLGVYYRNRMHTGLTEGITTSLFNDGLSDIVVVKSPDGKEYPIRFLSTLDDLPLI